VINIGRITVGVFVSRNVAYVADLENGPVMIDVSNLTNPIELGRYGDDYNFTYDVFVSGGIAYIADGGDGLEIVNVSDPKNPTKLGKVFQ